MWRETTAVARVLKELLCADKMNVAALGNVVKQMHMHVIARYTTDPAWPSPVWGKHPAKPYTRDAVLGLRDKLKAIMGDVLTISEGAL